MPTRIVLITIVAALLLFTGLAEAKMEELAKDIMLAVPLSTTTVLCVDDDSALFTVDITTHERTEWPLSWQPADDGWDGSGDVINLIASPDGKWVSFTQFVWINDETLTEHMVMEPPGCTVTVLAKADGSEARAVCLAQAAGGGPQYDFTTDSAWLVGQPMMRCEPDAEHYISLISTRMLPPLERYNYIDLATGKRGWMDDVDSYDGYRKCPYSDNFRIENNWYAEHRFSNFRTGGLLGEFTTPDELEAYISGWVLEDAVLLTGGSYNGVLYVDGTYIPAPGDTQWNVYCWLHDGTYIFTDDGSTVKYGKVDWPTFKVDWWVELPELTELEELLWSRVTPLPGSSGVLVWYEGVLNYLPVSRAGAKP